MSTQTEPKATSTPSSRRSPDAPAGPPKRESERSPYILTAILFGVPLVLIIVIEAIHQLAG